MSLYIIFYLQPIDEVLIELFNENITSEISLIKYYFCNHCNLYSQLVNLQFQDGHVYKMRKLKFFWSKPTLLKTAWGYLKIEKQSKFGHAHLWIACYSKSPSVTNSQIWTNIVKAKYSKTSGIIAWHANPNIIAVVNSFVLIDMLFQFLMKFYCQKHKIKVGCIPAIDSLQWILRFRKLIEF